MSSEFLRCNYLELIYCNKRGPVIFYHLHPPPQKSVSSKTKKTGPGFANTHHLAWYFCFLHILPSSTHQEDVLHAQRLPTFEALWRREWRIDVAVLFFSVTNSWMVNAKLWEKTEPVSPLTSPLPSIKEKHHILQVVFWSPFFRNLFFCFFRHLYSMPSPTNQRIPTLDIAAGNIESRWGWSFNECHWCVKFVKGDSAKKILGKFLGNPWPPIFRGWLVYVMRVYISSLQTERPIFHMMIDFKGNDLYPYFFVGQVVARPFFGVKVWWKLRVQFDFSRWFGGGGLGDYEAIKIQQLENATIYIKQKIMEGDNFFCLFTVWVKMVVSS